MKHVVLTSTRSHIYDFFLPIAARIWRDRIGYEPIIVLVGERREWDFANHKVVLDELASQSFRVEWIGHVGGIPDANVSMCVRQHVAALDLPEDDLLLVGDVDMLPIRVEFYHGHDPKTDAIGLYHANMYSDKYWPAYGVSMSVRNWREVMGLTVGDLLVSMERSMRDGGLYEMIAANQADYRDARNWTFDEEYASLKIRGSRFRESMFRRNSIAADRLCRHLWPDNPNISGYIDAHLPRPGYVGYKWEQVRGVLSQLIPNDLSWLDLYVSTYRSNGHQLHTA